MTLNGLSHTVSQPNWPGLKRNPGCPSGCITSVQASPRSWRTSAAVRPTNKQRLEDAHVQQQGAQKIARRSTAPASRGRSGRSSTPPCAPAPPRLPPPRAQYARGATSRTALFHFARHRAITTSAISAYVDRAAKRARHGAWIEQRQ